MKPFAYRDWNGTGCTAFLAGRLFHRTRAGASAWVDHLEIALSTRRAVSVWHLGDRVLVLPRDGTDGKVDTRIPGVERDGRTLDVPLAELADEADMRFIGWEGETLSARVGLDGVFTVTGEATNDARSTTELAYLDGSGERRRARIVDGQFRVRPEVAGDEIRLDILPYRGPDGTRFLPVDAPAARRCPPPPAFACLDTKAGPVRVVLLGGRFFVGSDGGSALRVVDELSLLGPGRVPVTARIVAGRLHVRRAGGAERATDRLDHLDAAGVVRTLSLADLRTGLVPRDIVPPVLDLDATDPARDPRAQGGWPDGAGTTVPVVSGATYTPGLPGSFRFSGTAVVTVERPSDGAGPVTLEAWVRAPAGEGTRSVGSTGPRGLVLVLAGGRPSFGPIADGRRPDVSVRADARRPDTLLRADVRVDDGAWHHVAATWDGRLARLFIDGVASAEGPLQATRGEAGTVRIGADPDGQAPLEGDVAILRMYDRALAPEDLAASYNAACPRFGHAPRAVGVAAVCRLLAHDGRYAEIRGCRYEVELTSLDASGRPLPGARVEIASADPVTLVSSSAGRITTVELGPPAPGVQPRWQGVAGPSGRLRLSIPATGLICPVLKVRHDGMTPGEYVLVAPDEGAHATLASLAPEDLTRGRKATATSHATRGILPNASASTAASVASAVRGAMATVADASFASSGGPLAFGIDEGAIRVGGVARTARGRPVTTWRVAADDSLARVVTRVSASEKAATDASSPEPDTGPLAFGIFEDAGRALDSAGRSAKKAVSGATDDLGDALGEAADAVEDGLGQGIDALENATRDATRRVVSGVQYACRVVVDGVEWVLERTIETVDDAIGVVVAIFDKLKVLVEQVLEFLAGLFDWGDILDTSDALYEAVERGLDSAPRALAAASAAFLEQADGLRATIAGAIGPPGPPPKGLGDLPHLDLGPLDYLVDLVEDGLDAAMPDVPFPKAIEDAAAHLSLPRDLDTTALDEAWARVTALIADPARLVTDGPATVRALLVAALDTAIQVLEIVAAGLPAALGALCRALSSLLTTRIDIPGVTPFVERAILGGRRLTLLRFVTLLGAVPVTLIHKLASGQERGPFSGLELGDGPLAFGLGSKERDAADQARAAAYLAVTADMAACVLSGLTDCAELVTIERAYHQVDDPDRIRGVIGELRRRGTWFTIASVLVWLTDLAAGGALERVHEQRPTRKALYSLALISGGGALLFNALTCSSTRVPNAELYATLLTLAEGGLTIAGASMDIDAADSEAARVLAGMDLGVTLTSLAQEVASRLPAPDNDRQAIKKLAKSALYAVQIGFDVDGLIAVTATKREEWT